MTEQLSDDETQDETAGVLRARVDVLESENNDLRQQADHRVAQAEMKVEALRAGMIDLDGLRFLDPAAVTLDESGQVAGGGELLAQLKQAKPWLFVAPSSSSAARVPPAKPSRPRLATDMNDEEYQAARANILRRSALG